MGPTHVTTSKTLDSDSNSSRHFHLNQRQEDILLPMMPKSLYFGRNICTQRDLISAMSNPMKDLRINTKQVHNNLSLSTNTTTTTTYIFSEDQTEWKPNLKKVLEEDFPGLSDAGICLPYLCWMCSEGFVLRTHTHTNTNTHTQSCVEHTPTHTHTHTHINACTTRDNIQNT